MKKTIVIKTKLHDSIYKSCGGGETTTHYEWKLGPRNLMAAIETLSEHARSMTQGYGDVGHSGSWIEVAGVEMSMDDHHDYDYDTDPSTFVDYNHLLAISKTKWCRRYIASVLDGSLIARRRENAEMRRRERLAYDDGFNAGLMGNTKPVNQAYFDVDYELDRGYEDGLKAREED